MMTPASDYGSPDDQHDEHPDDVPYGRPPARPPTRPHGVPPPAPRADREPPPRASHGEAEQERQQPPQGGGPPPSVPPPVPRVELARLRTELGAELSHLARLIRSEASRIERQLARRLDRASQAQTEELTSRLVRVQRVLLLADVATLAAMLVVAHLLL